METMEINKAPNEEYLEMMFVKETATGKGLNEQFIMENLHDGTFKKTKGRVNITVGIHKPVSYIRPISEWDLTYSKAMSLGFKIISQKKREIKTVTKGGNSINGLSFKDMASKAVQEMMNRLIGAASQLISKSYTIRVEDVSPEMLQGGKEILDELALGYEKMSVAEFNNKLKLLFATIPRRIDNLSKSLAIKTSDFRDIMDKDASNEKTLAEIYDLEWREVTDEEKDWIIKKMGSEGSRYVRAFKVINNKTEARFNDFCKKEGFTDKKGIERLFHGSRTENFWSIITNGLTINPTGVVITGKMFGNGTYFAPDACKSMGYTSRYGSKWANGSSDTGILGIYKVAVGNPAAPSSAKAYNWSSLSKQGYHSVWCKRGGTIGLRMDEVVVYQDCQDTIEYLVEVKF